MKFKIHNLAALGFSLLSGLFMSAAWAGSVDLSQSYLKAEFRQFNVPVTGEFKQFGGVVDFDPNKSQAVNAELTVKTSSFDVGDPEYNAELAGADWFDAAKYPQARFKVFSVQNNNAGWVGKGELTLRGKTLPVEFPVKVSGAKGLQIFTGQAAINRLDYGVGQGDWGDTSIVENQVLIRFKIAVKQ